MRLPFLRMLKAARTLTHKHAHLRTSTIACIHKLVSDRLRLQDNRWGFFLSVSRAASLCDVVMPGSGGMHATRPTLGIPHSPSRR